MQQPRRPVQLSARVRRRRFFIRLFTPLRVVHSTLGVCMGVLVSGQVQRPFSGFVDDGADSTDAGSYPTRDGSYSARHRTHRARDAAVRVDVVQRGFHAVDSTVQTPVQTLHQPPIEFIPRMFSTAFACTCPFARVPTPPNLPADILRKVQPQLDIPICRFIFPERPARPHLAVATTERPPVQRRDSQVR